MFLVSKNGSGKEKEVREENGGRGGGLHASAVW